jgi:hypothetical protein
MSGSIQHMHDTVGPVLDAHEHILVVASGQVCHCLVILDVDMLFKTYTRSLHTSMLRYVPVHTSIYQYIPQRIDTNCCPNFPTGRFRGPCVECCAPSRNSTWLFRLSYLVFFSGVGLGDEQPSGEEDL